MAARDSHKFRDLTPVGPAAHLHDGVIPVSHAELTDEHFLRSVALALRAEWEGDDHFAVAADSRKAGAAEPEPAAEWSEYRAESAAAILAFLEALHHRGFRIVRKAN